MKGGKWGERKAESARMEKERKKERNWRDTGIGDSRILE